MRTDYQTGKAQGTRIHNCGLCGRQFYESLLRECPERKGRRICMYCCGGCRAAFRDGSGWRCREFQREGARREGA